MNEGYGRDLDLNLLRVFVVVVEEKSVTAAAARLYLTQPAISAALKRLRLAIGAPLFAKQGRGVALTARGERLLVEVRLHLEALVAAAVSPGGFEAKTSTRTIRLGLSDAATSWLMPPLLRALDREAPEMRLITLPVQFRTVGEALTSGRIDIAVTVADDLPASIRRVPLFLGSFVCLHDPAHSPLPKKPTRAQYLAARHVVVSYNGDLRGIIEDIYGVQRRVRCAVASFDQVPDIVDGTDLVATVPVVVAAHIRRVRPHLATAPLPFSLEGTPMEMLWRAALDDDEAMLFLRAQVERAAAAGIAAATGN